MVCSLGNDLYIYYSQGRVVTNVGRTCEFFDNNIGVGRFRIYEGWGGQTFSEYPPRSLVPPTPPHCETF